MRTVGDPITFEDLRARGAIDIFGGIIELWIVNLAIRGRINSIRYHHGHWPVQITIDDPHTWLHSARSWHLVDHESVRAIFPPDESEFFIGPFENESGMICFAGRQHTAFIFPKNCKVPEHAMSEIQRCAVQDFKFV